MGKSKSKRKRKLARITQDQGTFLFRLSANFTLPEKLGGEKGDGEKYNVAERGLAGKNAGLLYDELKWRSDLYASKKMFLFGPAENWKSTKVGDGEKWDLEDPNAEVKIRINKEIRQGMFWCLLMALHPAGSMPASVYNQADTLWPLADRLGLRPELEKEMGIDTAKMRSLELEGNDEFEEDDPEDDGEEVEEEEEAAASEEK